MPTQSNKLFDHRMKDGSRNFVDLPETIFFNELRDITEKFEGSEVTDFISDCLTEVWLDFEYRGHKFSINNQMGEYWFFVENPQCLDEILLEVVEYFEKFLTKS